VRREDVPPLLEDAAGELPQADMADAAWAGGFAIRRRRRRSTVMALAVVLVIGAIAALAAGFGGGKANQTPPTMPPSSSGEISLAAVGCPVALGPGIHG